MHAYTHDPSSARGRPDSAPMLSEEPARRQIELEYYFKLVDAHVVDPVAAQVARDWARMQNPRFGWLGTILTMVIPKRAGFGRY